MNLEYIDLIYIVSSILFIFGLKMLGRPESARRGNQISSLGMLLAIVATLAHQNILSYQWILAGFILGGTIGTLGAIKVKMTSMPEMVALFNGFGGAASVLVAGSALVAGWYMREDDPMQRTTSGVPSKVPR